MNDIGLGYQVILWIACGYVISLLVICLIGLIGENIIKGGKKWFILEALEAGLRISYSDKEMVKRLRKPNTHTLGGVIDEMVRSKTIIRTATLEPIPHWIITRHPQRN